MTQDFIRERQYLKAVTPKTLIWYNCSFKAFENALDSKQAIVQRVAELCERGVSPVSINTYLRCVNAYFMWLHKEHGKPLVKIPRLKEEQKILGTLSQEQRSRLIAFKPRNATQTRTHTVALLILDGGYRISEVLGLQFEHVDLDNLVVKVRGKGNKHRLVPLSVDMRKVLYRYASRHSGPGRLLFGTRNNTLVTVRNFEREFKRIGGKLNITGVRFSPHTLRHTFAVSYLRAGGNLFYLSRILGHSSVTTTQKYLQSVGVDDLKAVHDRLSPLSPAALRGGMGR
jgi:site-specific recombinase XerD